MMSSRKTKPAKADIGDAAEAEPARDCPLCPRLVAFRTDWRVRQPDSFNAPVHSFGPLDARLLALFFFNRAFLTLLWRGRVKKARRVAISAFPPLLISKPLSFPMLLLRKQHLSAPRARPAALCAASLPRFCRSARREGFEPPTF